LAGRGKAFHDLPDDTYAGSLMRRGNWSRPHRGHQATATPWRCESRAQSRLGGSPCRALGCTRLASMSKGEDFCERSGERASHDPPQLKHTCRGRVGGVRF
jgi:hypothetical protein